jgi:glycosyltransferase involved in cell wall biosynthesis
MKILQVNDIGYEAGGAEKSVLLIRDELRRRGHEVHVLATDKNSNGKDVFADILVPAICGVSVIRLFKHFWNHTAYRRIRSAIRDFEPDIIHFHNVSEFSPSIIQGIDKVPSIMTVHGPEEFTLELLPWLMPASDYKNNSYKWTDIRLRGRLRYVYYRYLQRPAYLRVLKRLKFVIAPSAYMKQAIRPDFPNSQIIQIYNGIDLPEKAPLPQPSPTTILYVGRLEAVKGVDVLLNAFSRVLSDSKETRLRIVGDGSQRETLQALARKLGLSDSVEFAGWVKPHDIAKEYAAAQMLVVPSIWPENLPTVITEALAVGRPIIGSNRGGIPELIDDGSSGFIVESGDEKALAEAIHAVLVNPRILQMMAKASHAKSRMFDDKIFVEKLLKTYQGVLDENTAC